MAENLKPAADVLHIKFVRRVAFYKHGKPRYGYKAVDMWVKFRPEHGTTRIVFNGRDIKYTRHRYRDKPFRFDMNGYFYMAPIYTSSSPEFHYKNTVIRYVDCPDSETFCGRVNMVLDNLRLEKEIDSL